MSELSLSCLRAVWNLPCCSAWTAADANLHAGGALLDSTSAGFWSDQLQIRDMTLQRQVDELVALQVLHTAGSPFAACWLSG